MSKLLKIAGNLKCRHKLNKLAFGIMLVARLPPGSQLRTTKLATFGDQTVVVSIYQLSIEVAGCMA